MCCFVANPANKSILIESQTKRAKCRYIVDLLETMLHQVTFTAPTLEHCLYGGQLATLYDVWFLL